MTGIVTEKLLALESLRLYSATGRDWELRVHHSLTEPELSCPTATIGMEGDNESVLFRADKDTIDDAIIAVVDMAYDEWIMKGNIPEPESIGAQETDVVNKHDNPWVQIEQLQMEIERLQGEIAQEKAHRIACAYYRALGEAADVMVKDDIAQALRDIALERDREIDWLRNWTKARIAAYMLARENG